MSDVQLFDVDLEGVENFQDFLEKIKNWKDKINDVMDDYEIGSITLNIAAPPSASITIVKKGTTLLAIPAS